MSTQPIDWDSLPDEWEGLPDASTAPAAPARPPAILQVNPAGTPPSPILARAKQGIQDADATISDLNQPAPAPPPPATPPEAPGFYARHPITSELALKALTPFDWHPIEAAQGLARGVKKVITGEGAEQYPRAAGAHEAISGALNVIGAPAMAATAATANLPAAAAIGVGMGAQYLTRKALELVKANPELSDLASDIVGLIAGGKMGAEEGSRLLEKPAEAAKVVQAAKEPVLLSRRAQGLPEEPAPVVRENRTSETAPTIKESLQVQPSAPDSDWETLPPAEETPNEQPASRLSSSQTQPEPESAPLQVKGKLGKEIAQLEADLQRNGGDIAEERAQMDKLDLDPQAYRDWLNFRNQQEMLKAGSIPGVSKKIRPLAPPEEGVALPTVSPTNDFLNTNEDYLRQPGETLQEFTQRIRTLENGQIDTSDARMERLYNEAGNRRPAIDIEAQPAAVEPEAQGQPETAPTPSKIVPGASLALKSEVDPTGQFPTLHTTELTDADGQRIGHVNFEADPHQPGTARILDTDLAEEQRGKGAGQELYQKALDDAKSLKFNKVQSDMMVSDDANRVWPKLGATEATDVAGNKVWEKELNESPAPQFGRVELSPGADSQGNRTWTWFSGEDPISTHFSSREDALANLPAARKIIDDEGNLVVGRTAPLDIRVGRVEEHPDSYGTKTVAIQFSSAEGKGPGAMIGSSDEMVRKLFPDLAGEVHNSRILKKAFGRGHSLQLDFTGENREALAKEIKARMQGMSEEGSPPLGAGPPQLARAFDPRYDAPNDNPVPTSATEPESPENAAPAAAEPSKTLSRSKSGPAYIAAPPGMEGALARKFQEEGVPAPPIVPMSHELAPNLPTGGALAAVDRRAVERPAGTAQAFEKFLGTKGLTRADYARLSPEEQRPIIGEFGHSGIQSVLGLNGNGARGPVPNSITQVPTGSLTVDPERFQFRVGGTTNRLKDVGAYRPELAGVVSVWTDPADGKTYVVNGHHRVALAQRTGHPTVNAFHIEAPDAKTARAIGALQNIAEGNATAVDAGKFFRDTGATPETLANEGISLGTGTAKQGMALSHLDDYHFNRVVTGQEPIERAAMVGEATSDPATQDSIFKQIAAKEAKGGHVSNDVVREFIKFAAGSPETTATEQNLFGEQEVRKNLAWEKATVSEAVRKQIAKEKAVFGSLKSEGKAETLARAGNVINAGENARIAERASQDLALYDKLSNTVGPVSSILDDAAKRLAAGDDPNAVKTEAAAAIRAELPKALSNGLGNGSEGNAPVQPSQGDIFANGGATPASPTYGENNVLVSKDQATAAAQRLSKLGSRLSSGIDPTALPDLVRLGVFHLEAGTRAFGDWSAKMIESVGEKYRPFLHAIYQQSQREHLRLDDPQRITQSLADKAIADIGTLKTRGTFSPELSGQRAAEAKGMRAAMGDKEISVSVKRLDSLKNALPRIADNIARMSEQAKAEGAKPGYVEALDAEVAEAKRFVQSLVLHSSEAGRILQSLQRFKEIPPEQMNTLRSHLDPEEFGKLESFLNKVKTGPKPTWTDMAFEAWRNGLLSAPTTFAKHLISSSLLAVHSGVKSLATAGVEAGRSLATGTPRERFAGEAPAAAYGAAAGFKNAMANALASFKTEKPITGLSTIEGSRQGAIPGELGRAIRVPQRMIGASVEGIKTMALEGSLHEQAYRQAAQEGFSPRDLDQMTERIDQLTKNPTPQMIQNAQAAAAHTTLSQPFGPMARDFSAGVNKIWGARWLLPFKRILINGLKTAYQESPASLPQNLAQVAQGKIKGAALSDLAGKHIVGTALTWLIWDLAERGVITGGGPSDPQKKNVLYATGWLPNSFKLGESYRSYLPTEPFASWVSEVADLHDFAKSGEIEGPQFERKLNDLVGASLKNLGVKSFTQGLATLSDAVSRPDEAWQDLVKNFGASIVPNLMADAERSTDHYFRNPSSFAETLKSRIPGLGETVPPLLDIHGQPVKRSGSPVERFLSPMYRSDLTHDPVAEEMARLGMGEGRPAHTLTRGKTKITLNPADYQAMAGEGGQVARRRLQDIIGSENYEKLGDEQKTEVIRRIIDQARKGARLGTMAEKMREAVQ